MRRKLIILLILFCAVLALPAAVSAAVGSTYSDANFTYRELSDGTLSVTGYMGPGGNVVIPSTYDPGSGEMQISDIAVSAFYNKQSITGVTIPASVVTIGRDAFYLCDNLASVTFMPDSKLETIGMAAFRDAGITSVTIPASVVTIDQDAFIFSDLASLTFEPESNLQTIGQGAFYATSLREVTIPASVTTLSKDVFLRCRNLESVIFEPGSNLSAIGESAFFETAISSIILPDSIQTIGDYAFGLSAIKSITIPANVVTIKNAFYFCENLTSVTFAPGSHITTIGEGAFYNTGLSSIILPSSVETIGDSAFAGSAIKSITIPASVTSIGAYAFNVCESLESITFSPGSNLTTIGQGAFAYTGLSSISLPDSVETIGDSAFAYSAIKYITIPANTTLIGKYAFFYSQLEKIAVLSSGVVFNGNYVFNGAPMSDGIFGYVNSTAQTYAASIGINFYTLLYKVTFDTQGGSEIAPEYTGSVGKESIDEPTGSIYTGYHIDGWYFENYCENKVSFPYTPENNVTIYAHWTINSYTVVYNAPDADSGSTVSSSHTYNVSASLTLNGFSRAGYLFSGWAESESGDVAYTDGESIINLTDSDNAVVNLYAVWTPINYTVEYLPNGSTSGSTISSSHKYGISSNLTSNGFIKEGYTFSGWAETEDGDVAYNNAESVLNLSNQEDAVIQLYAVWTPIKYIVEYISNGATIGSTSSSSHTYDVSAALTLNGFSRAGYLFSGWAESETGDVVYSDGENIINLTDSDSDIVHLYAVWTPINYTVEYIGNGATSGSMTSSNHTYEVPKKLTLNGYKKSGFVFSGWSKIINGPVVYSNGQNVKNLTDIDKVTVTLYAKWTAAGNTAKTYTVKYNGNGATGGSTAISRHTYGISSQLTMNGYTKDNNTFKGWAETSDGAAVYKDGETVLNLTDTNNGIVELYAVWSQIISLTCDDNDKTISIGEKITITPPIDSGTWEYDEAYLSRDGNIFTALKAGMTKVTYNTPNSEGCINITINENDVPKTKTNKTAMYIWITVGVIIVAASIGLIAAQRRKRN